MKLIPTKIPRTFFIELEQKNPQIQAETQKDLNGQRNNGQKDTSKKC